MKTSRIIYWVTTGIVALMMSYSAFAYITKPEMVKGFQHLGFPDYFRVELAVGKLIGVVLLLSPVAARVKEWAYAGFGITFVSAFIAHSASGDPIAMRAMPLVLLVLLGISYYTRHKIVSTDKVSFQQPARG